MRRVPLVLLILGPSVVGCAPSASRGLVDDDASNKIPAMKQAVASDDKAAATQLVTELDNDDPAVRFYAIEALRRLTGETFEYRYFDHESARRPAVDRWKLWLAERDAK